MAHKNAEAAAAAAAQNVPAKIIGSSTFRSVQDRLHSNDDKRDEGQEQGFNIPISGMYTSTL